MRLLSTILVTEKESEENVKTTLLMIGTILQSVPKRASDKYIPYHLLKYKIPRRYATVNFQLITAESIYRPCLLVPCWGRNINNGFDKACSNATNHIRMWCVDYKRIDRSGYEDIIMNQQSIAEDEDRHDEEVNDEQHHVPLFPDSDATLRAYAYMATHFAQQRGANDDDEEDEDSD